MQEDMVINMWSPNLGFYIQQVWIKWQIIMNEKKRNVVKLRQKGVYFSCGNDDIQYQIGVNLGITWADVSDPTIRH